MNSMLETARGSKVRRGNAAAPGELAWVEQIDGTQHTGPVFVTTKMARMADVAALPAHAVPVVDLMDAELSRPQRAYAVFAKTPAEADFAVRRGHTVILGARPNVPGALHFELVENDTTVSGATNHDAQPAWSPNEPIAIIGMGAVMPGANTAKLFWENIKAGVSAIREVPADRWNAEIFHDDDRHTPDKTYSKIGGWITDYEFDRKLFRMPPSIIEKIDPTQLICLTAVREALQDAGYLEREFDRDRCAVILGNSLGGDLRDQTTLRVHFAEIEAELRQILGRDTSMTPAQIEAVLATASQVVKGKLVEVNEDSMPGELANVIAGRVASAFDLRGPNFVCDAACASALAAIDAAVRGLRARQFDIAVTGGSDRTMGPPSFVKFSKIGALSADGSRPFDENANGFVMGEGAGILVLKRLSDAVRDNDRIYAVIRGVAGSSDGKGKGITAPNPRGQVLAMRRAWADAGLSPRTATLIEAHGTSTPVGDPIEVGSMRTVLEESDGDYVGDVRLGSVKSMIGHLKSAAGAAGMIKVAYALHEKVLPPTINVRKVNPALELEKSRIRLQTQTEPWKIDGIRRAGVSAFGFGGTNFHVVLEEYVPEALGQSLSEPQAPKAVVVTTPIPLAAQGGVLAFASHTLDELQSLIARAQAEIESTPAAYKTYLLTPGDDAPQGKFRLAVAFGNPSEITAKLSKAADALQTQKGWKVLANQGIVYSDTRMGGLLAMLSPGQGSQYLHMGSELAAMFPVVKQTFDEADAVMFPILGRPLSEVVAPDLSRVDESDAFLALSQTEITQPAVLTVDVAIARLLAEFGVQPDMVAGHSLGEYGACVAAGVMSFADALRTVAARGTEMAKATPMDGDCGVMASVPAPVDVVEEVLRSIDGYVVCANKNCPTQTIIAGLTEPTHRAMKIFEEMGYQVVQLPVSHAFHSKVVAMASEPLRRHLETVGIHAPQLPILTNVTGDLYPNFDGCETAIRDLLAQQVAAPVEYIQMVERMYKLGARTFVEVGPKRAQQAFVQAILSDREHLALFTNHPKKGELNAFFEALAQLWVSGAMDTEEVHVDAQIQRAAMAKTAPEPGVRGSALPGRDEILVRMTQILCDKTGYDPAEIEPGFELEADLGIDTVKQAEIMAAVREIYGFERDDQFKLAQYPSLNHLADYVLERVGAGAPADMEVGAPTDVKAVAPATVLDRNDVIARMTQVLCDKTGYDPAEIEPGFELEADLGIDTVKQAEIMAAVREIYGFERDDQFKLAQYPSLNHLADYVLERVGAVTPADVKVGAPADVKVGAPADVKAVAPADVKAVAPADVKAVAPADVKAVAPADVKVGAPATALDRDDVIARMTQVLCDKTGYDPAEIEPGFELEADLGIDTVKQAEIMAAVREIYGFERDDQFKLAQYPSLNHLADYVLERVGAVTPADVEVGAPAEVKAVAPANVVSHVSNPTQPTRRVTITGCALGLPGDANIFADDTVDQLLAGVNFIGAVSDHQKNRIVQKRIVRLVKHKDGGGDMEEVTSPDEVIKLAGRPGEFDVSEWGLPERLVEQLDDTSQMAIAAGLIALQDAGIPLVPRYRLTTSGKKVTVGWSLPEEVAAETGVIFASAFAGQDALIDEVLASTEPGYQFNHRFLLRVLGIANSRFAELVGARGPNTKINNACASTTTAIALAQDWISLGRCKRVIVLGADNASGESLFEWVGAGFLATGAASTEAKVEDAALPFDRRRDGMIIGMGAVALIVEAPGLAESRGIEPIAEVLGTRFVNSALHPTRLDVDHIAGEVDALLHDVESEYGLNRHDFARKTVFVSHETYTPARGGSADAEIASLRRAFGDQADDVVIANTKGFTGHAMGAGIEDVLAIKALQRRQLPHIANFKEPDPNLGNLRLSQGGQYDLDYALRLAAGFGSQLAVAFLRFRARTENRLMDAELHQRWLARVSGFEHPETFVEHRTLKLREAQPEAHAPVPVTNPVVATNGAAKPMLTRVEPVSVTAIRPQSVIAQAKTAARVDADRIREHLNQRNVVVLAGPPQVTSFLVRSLSMFGANVHVFRDLRGSLNQDGTALDLNDEALLAREFKALGRIDGVVNLLGFGVDGDVQELERAPLYTFNVARAWLNAGANPAQGNFFLSVTGMGGRLGFDRAAGPLPVCGAVAGMTKALSREWPQARVKVVDVAREGYYPELGRQILDALFDENTGNEIGVLGGVQWGPTYIEPSEIFAHGISLLPRPNDVILVTGGARGITAEITRDLAKRAPATYVIVGRTAYQGDAVLHVDLEAKKTEIKASLQATGQKVTPVMVQRELGRIVAQQEIARTLADLRALGARAEYRVCDLSAPDDVQRLVSDVRSQFGPIAGFIHGAGVEESKLIAQKDRAGFDRVFRGKAIGALALWEATRSETLKFAVFFSSVAGRFGNVGQTDYSAANEALNKLAQLINASTPTRAISIDWTAWDDIGMATEGSMKQILETRGIELLPAAQGAPMLGNLLADGIFGEVLVAGRLGDMFDGPVPIKAELAAVTRTTEKATFERTLSLDDPFMRDHIYESNALLPGVMGLELMHEAARELGHETWSAHNVRFDKAVKLLRNEPVTVRITAERQGDDVVARLETNRKTVTGRQIDELHFEATFAQTPDRTPPQWVINTHDALEGPSHDDIYTRFFHTGVFRVLDRVPIITDEFIVAYGRVPALPLIDGKDGGQVATQPLLTEMMFQAIGVWGMIFKKVTSLPNRIESWELFRTVSAGATVAVRARLVEVTGTHLIFDAEVRDEFGHLVAYAERVELIIHQPLARDLEFSNLERARGTIAQMTDPEARAWIADHNLSIEEMLGDTETESWTRFMSERRKSEWLAARVAAKVGIAAWVRDVRGLAAHPRDVLIEKDENKAPFARMRGALSNYDAPLPHLSVAHSGGVAVVHVGLRTDMRIGVDLETVEAREESFANEYFTPAELQFGADLPREKQLTVLWTIKEAVSKALGLGLHVRLSEITITDLSHTHHGWNAQIELTDEAAQALADLRGESMDIRVFDLGNFVLSEATFDAVSEAREPEATVVPEAEDAQMFAAVAALLHRKGLLKTTPRGEHSRS